MRNDVVLSARFKSFLLLSMTRLKKVDTNRRNYYNDMYFCFFFLQCVVLFNVCLLFESKQQQPHNAAAHNEDEQSNWKNKYGVIKLK